MQVLKIDFYAFMTTAHEVLFCCTRDYASYVSYAVVIIIITLNDIIISLVPIRYFCVRGTRLHHYVLDFMFIVLMTTAHEEPGGGQDGGCVDEVTQQTLSKYLICKHNEYY